MLSTLVLNASYEPLAIVSGRRAVLLIMQGKAASLDDSEQTINSASTTVQVPYVVLLNRYVKIESAMKPAAWSKRGVLVRDAWRCVYCGDRANTIDHVIPQSKGGPSSYENCVAACQPCNLKKGDHSLKQMGWTVPFVPKAPPMYTMMLGKIARLDHQGQVVRPGDRRQLEAWSPYFTMHQPELAGFIAKF